MEIIGYLLAIIMGFTLGLFGGGGSILTVPILVYVFQLSPVLAAAYSLFVVGSTAVIGAWQKHRENLVQWKEGIIFAAPSLLSVFLTRYYLVPAIPDVLFRFNTTELTKDTALLIFFGFIMLLASYSMIKGKKEAKQAESTAMNYPLIVSVGIGVGLIAGLVGAGGGFLIVPALAIMLRLPIKQAIGTSLMIIAVNSLIGFLGDLGSGQHIDWRFLSVFTLFSIVGMFLGIYTTRYVQASKLKKGFGWFVLVMAILIILAEVM